MSTFCKKINTEIIAIPWQYMKCPKYRLWIPGNHPVLKLSKFWTFWTCLQRVVYKRVKQFFCLISNRWFVQISVFGCPDFRHLLYSELPKSGLFWISNSRLASGLRKITSPTDRNLDANILDRLYHRQKLVYNTNDLALLAEIWITKNVGNLDHEEIGLFKIPFDKGLTGLYSISK